ncbi:MAG TPA: sigma-70 family RNA polymerase sigma factor [Candidatus Dormibacteraeota bacterium]|nr:sigma-70 family RNA polymerase sigma factor [Candidatus Dormibacteraeota bacterium]
MPEPAATPAVDQALAAIYAREGTRLVALARVLSGDLDAGEDLAQEVFIRALRALQRDPEYLYEPVWPWLRTTLVRLVIERRRRLRREMSRLLRLDRAAATTEWPMASADVAAALASLPPRMRACVVLRYCEDLSTLDVANTLGCAPGTVVVQLREARKRLRLWLDGGEDGTDG